VLCNNAGVGAGGLIADLALADWQWVLGVNLWGVIHGVHAFLPRMLAGGEPGHIVNTASLAGHVSAPFMGPYSASKFAVVAISESLHHEMNLAGGAIGVSVLCPGWVNTNIHSSERNRPAALGGSGAGVLDGRAEMLKQVLADGMAPADVADLVVGAIHDGRFYVLTHPDMTPAIESRMKAILEGANPTLQLIG
jgi:NAD(P)-dependent dehydrogenase (short-subunit alcohol dehydrogenase family)